MQNTSNYIKATLFFNDINEVKVKKEQGFTLQQFNYECSRNRNNMGMPYGPTGTTIILFQIKSLPDGYLKEIYRRLDENTVSNFSVAFNATFKTDEYGDNILSDYDSSLVVTGFVISVEESYSNNHIKTASKHSKDEETTANLMMTNVGLLTKSITYIGSENYKKNLYINF